MAYFWILVYLSNFTLDTNQVWLCRWHVPCKVIILVSTTGKFLPLLLFFSSLTMVASSSFSILNTHHVNSRHFLLICCCQWWHSWRWEIPLLNCLDQFFKWVPGHDEPKGLFSPKKKEMSIQMQLKTMFALIYPIRSLWYWFAAFCVAKNGTKTGGQRDIEVRLKVICINFTALNIRICT